jgi:hypothetical protein
MMFNSNPRIATRASIAAIAALMLSASAQAASFTWPDTTAPCNTTLQACIDGVASPSILFIATNDVTNTGAVSQSIRLQRSMFLRAAEGFRPVFPVGVGIISSPTSAIDVGIVGLTLRDAYVRLLPSAGGSFYVEQMQLIGNGSNSGIDFEALGASPTSVYLRVHDNEYLRRGAAGNFLSVATGAATISGEVSFNRVSIPDTGSSAYGMIFGASGSGSFNLTVANNEIRSGFAFGGICALSNAPTGTPTASSIRIHGNVFVPLRIGSGTAICVFGGEGAIDARITHNTIVGFGNAISLVTRPFSPPASVQPISGFVIGNLLAHNNTALRRDGIAAIPGDAVTNGQNLFFDNNVDFGGTSPATAGSGTVTSDPLLYSLQYPYLKTGSPAIGNGNGLAVPPGFPLLDTDGSRRFKNTPGGGSIDIGAYEFGDNWFNTRANGSNNSSNTLLLPHPSLDGAQSARALVTPNFSLGSIPNNVPFGVYYNTSSMLWSVFNQSTTTPIPTGAGYSAFTPAPGTGLFLHQLASIGPTLSETLLDNTAVNGLIDQIVVTTANWNPATSTGVYNNHNVNVAYNSGDERWRIGNADGVALPNSAAFNVYAQPSSVSAFRHTVSAGNSPTVNSTVIDNPRLNGFRCAELMVTPLASFGDRRFDVFYSNSSQRWQIFSSSTLPDGTQFNVIFSPRQIAECGRPIFESSFEN